MLVDNEMTFSEVPQESIPIESIPGGQYFQQKTSGFITKFTKYFNITTDEVLDRIVVSLIPNKANFLTRIESNPDLYGPFWITITVSFLCFSLGNISHMFRYGGNYVYYFGSLVSAATLLSLFVFAFPFAIWFYKKALSPPLVLLMTLFGYSVLYLIPGSLAITIFGINLGYLLNAVVSGLGSFSIFTKFEEYQNSSDRGIKDKPLSMILAVSYFIVHMLVTYTCFK
ncbi:Yip1 domain family, member 1 [Tritrichomonas foetus]|uniref:Yip1 domain family, member 1 n=1 Tax=Tritrichomonas foetus TaxID=1144522 RepID=A0A1J4JYF8_9EUKA|nr:Yip1 domain family, member 1 [Tritrichomonas foetus]|eukprot:OHT04193.1 Yip1 domain family, member 1 [Tritrichomonas foetus]